MEMITAYLAGVVALVGLWAWRAPHEDVRVVFVLALIWPGSILAILAVIVLNATDWDVDAAKGTRMFGFRKPTNPSARGFAVTVFGTEFQFYTKRKNG